MARKRDSSWIWITVAVIGGIIFVPIFVLRILGMAGQPGCAFYDIHSGSMFPSVRLGDYILAFANVYRNEVPPRGQIVVFKHPRDGTTDYIKRVVGLPGDRIQLRAGRLYINDQLVSREPASDADVGDTEDSGVTVYRETLPDGATYLIAETGDEEMLDNTTVFTVPAGNVFVLGDNRDRSSDSRVGDGVGYVPLTLLRDRPLLVYWSTDLKRIGETVR